MTGQLLACAANSMQRLCSAGSCDSKNAAQSKWCSALSKDRKNSLLAELLTVGLALFCTTIVEDLLNSGCLFQRCALSDEIHIGVGA